MNTNKDNYHKRQMEKFPDIKRTKFMYHATYHEMKRNEKEIRRLIDENRNNKDLLKIMEGWGWYK